MKKIFLLIVALCFFNGAHAATRYVEVDKSRDTVVGIKLSAAKTEVVTTKYNLRGKAYEETYIVTTFKNGNKCYRRINMSTGGEDRIDQSISCVKNAGE